jgi:hypothetical protein
MATLVALQHLFSSVQRGYFTHHGRGFQTVAVSRDLVGTEDLKIIEDAAFYSLNYERRSAGKAPVKETFFHLPSERMAIGRTVYLGTDALGRDGNYLSHHLVFDREELLKASPFAILESASLAGPHEDLTPRELPLLKIDLNSGREDSDIFIGLDFHRLAALSASALEARDKTVLLVGDEAISRRLLKAASASLATEERLGMTFSTHFYESHHLRPLFAAATVELQSEAPSQRENYSAIFLDEREVQQVKPNSHYAAYLAETLRKQDWKRVMAFNNTLDALRKKEQVMAQGSLFESAQACRALWERAGGQVAPLLLGNARLVKRFIESLSSPRPLVECLLAASSPSELLGQALPEEATDCLSALKSAVTGKEWNGWMQKWNLDPALEVLPERNNPWWKLW